MSSTFALPDRMRGVTTHLGSVPELQTVPVPTQLNAEAIIRIEAAALTPPEMALPAGATPAGLGFCGEVVTPPYALAAVSAGQRVYGMGSSPRGPSAYAEYIAAPVDALAPAPRALDAAHAAVLADAGLAAWGIVAELARARAGQRILVLNASGAVGHLAVQLGRYFGATVIATGTEQEVDFLNSLDVSSVLPLPAEGPLTSDRIDVVVDLTAPEQNDLRAQALEVLRPGGLFLTLPNRFDGVLAKQLHRAQVRASGYWPTPSGTLLGVLGRLVDAGDLQVCVTNSYSLEQLPGILNTQVTPAHGGCAIQIAPTA